MAGKKFNRNTNQRKALFKGLIMNLFEHGEIETTLEKAKSMRGLVDKLMTKARQGTVSARRIIAGFFGTRAIVNKVVDEIAPAMKDRTSGFTRIIRIGNRVGDDAMRVKMQLVEKPKEKVEVKPVKTAKPVVEKKKAK